MGIFSSSSIANGTVLLDSVSLMGMQGSKRTGKARCINGYSWYALGPDRSNTVDTTVSARQLYFCAPVTVAREYPLLPRYARIRNTTSVREGNGIGKPIVMTTLLNGRQIRAGIWWAERENCTVCGERTYPSGSCSYTSNTVCTICDCKLNEHETVPCDGKTVFNGCTRCSDSAFKGDNLGHDWNMNYWVPADTLNNKRAQNRIVCRPGSYNTYSNENSTLATCTPAGWNIEQNTTCQLCDPPRVPYTVTPLPAVGTKDTFEYSCAPGFRSIGGNILRQCPRTHNRNGLFTGTPLQCTCQGIDNTHTCSILSSPTTEEWITGNGNNESASFLVNRYTANPNWITTGTSPDARTQLLVGVRYIFRITRPGGEILDYNFNTLKLDSVSTGEIRIANTEQYYSTDNVLNGYPYAHAEVILRITTGTSNVPVPVTIATTEYPNALELWSGATSALKTKQPTAALYFALQAHTDDFILRSRISLVNGTGGIGNGLYDEHYLREKLQKSRPEEGNIEGYFTKRTVAGIDLQWLYRKCPAGTYQIGDQCVNCPDNTYSIGNYKALILKEDGSSLVPVTGTAGQGAMCTNCGCANSCDTCGPGTATCTTRPYSCNIGSVCMAAGTLSPTNLCLWCNPTNSSSKYVPVPVGNVCDDGDACTVDDMCTGDGVCRGRTAACLASRTDASQNCEICARTGCKLRPDYNGCVAYNLNGTKTCGCSIEGICYPHGTMNINNPCVMCDVTQNPSGWVPTPAQLCDDGNNCTYGDICYAGTCEGTPIDCSPQGPCVATSTCQGTEKCLITYKPSTFICAEGTGACNVPSRCTGFDSYCPVAVTLTPVITRGTLVPQISPTGRTLPLTSQEALPFIPTLATYTNTMMDTNGNPLIGFPSVTTVSFSIFNWTAPCAALEFRMGIFIGNLDSPCVTEQITDTDAGGRGWTAWKQGTTIVSTDGLTVPSINGIVLDKGIVTNDGDTVRVRVEARSTMTEYQEAIAASCIHVTTDSSPPVAGTVRNIEVSQLVDDGTKNYRYTRTNEIGITWSDFYDAQVASTWGGLLQYRFAVGTAPGSIDVVSWRWVGTASSAQTHAYADYLPSFVPLYVTVEGFNRAGLKASVTGLSVIIDSTGPIMQPNGFVYDGIDIDSVSKVPIPRLAIGPKDIAAGTGLSAQWYGIEETDPNSGLDHYEIAFGYGPGMEQIWPFTIVPGGAKAEAVTIPFANWVKGVRYVATVRAVSLSGAYTDFPSSGIIYDDTPPTDVQFVTNQNYISCQTTNLLYTYTEDSAIQYAEVWVGSFAGGEDILPPTIVRGTNIAKGFTLPVLPGSTNGRSIYISVVLTNIAGLTSILPATQRFIQDCFVPNFLTVPLDYDPANIVGSAVLFHTGPSLVVRFNCEQKGISGLVSSQIRLFTFGTLPISTTSSGPVMDAYQFGNGTLASIEVMSWTSTQGSNIFQYGTVIPTVVPGWTYYSEIQCTNGAGISTSAITPGIVVDSTPPSVSITLIPTGKEKSGYLASTSLVPTILSVNDPESGILSARIALGYTDSEAKDSVTAWRTINENNLSYNFTNLQLIPGTSYIIWLEATNRAGTVTTVASSSFIVDSTSPMLGTGSVIDGAGTTDVQSLPALTTIDASWSDVCNDPESGIASYTYCAGSASGSCDLVPPTVYPSNVTSVSVPVPSLYSCGVSPSRMLLEDYPVPSHIEDTMWIEENEDDEYTSPYHTDSKDDHDITDEEQRFLATTGIDIQVFRDTFQSSPKQLLTRQRRLSIKMDPTMNDYHHQLIQKNQTDELELYLQDTEYTRTAHQRVLQTSQTAPLPLFGPDWILALGGVCTSRLAIGLDDHWGCFGGSLFDHQVRSCNDNFFCFCPCRRETKAHHQKLLYTVTNGMADLGSVPRVFYRGNYIPNPGCENIYIIMNLYCNPARPLFSPETINRNWFSNGCGYQMDIGLAEMCGQPLQYRIAAAAPVGPPAMTKKYAALCISGVLRQGTTLNNVKVCPFGTVTHYTGTNVAGTVIYGYFDSWSSTTAVAGGTAYSTAMFTGGATCLGLNNLNIQRQAYVRYICSPTSTPILSTGFFDENGCVLRLTIAIPEACGLGLTVLDSATLPSPSASPSTLPDKYFADTSNNNNGNGNTNVSPSPSPTGLVPTSNVRTDPRPYYGPPSLTSVIGTCSVTSLTSILQTPSDIGIPLPTGTTALKICPLQNVSAVLSNGKEIILGYWDAWTVRRQGGGTWYDRWLFEGGTCASGGSLTLMVTPTCPTTAGTGTRIIAVSQDPTECILRMQVTIPAICALSSCTNQYIGRIYNQVECKNGVGMSIIVRSDGATVDPLAVSTGVMYYGPPSNTRLATSISSGTGTTAANTVYYFAGFITLTLRNFTTFSSPIRRYTVSVGSRPGASDILSPVDYGGSVVIEIKSINYTSGQMYYPTVVATTQNGAAVMISADIPAMFSNAVPTMTTVGVSTDNLNDNAVPPMYTSWWTNPTVLRVCAAGVLETTVPLSSFILQIGSTEGSVQYGQFTSDKSSSGTSTLSVMDAERDRTIALKDFRLASITTSFASINENSITLTNGAYPNQRTVAHSRHTVPINRNFRISFTFSMMGSSPTNFGHSIALLLHRDPRDITALGNQAGGCFGAMSVVSAITPAVAFAIQPNATGNSTIGIYRSGLTNWTSSTCPTVHTSARFSSTAFRIEGGRVWRAVFTYNRATGNVTYFIQPNDDSFTRTSIFNTSLVNLEAHLGSNEAYIGIGVGTGTAGTRWILENNEWEDGTVGPVRIEDLSVKSIISYASQTPESIGPFPERRTICARYTGLQLPVNRPLVGTLTIMNSVGFLSSPLNFSFIVDPSPPKPVRIWAGRVSNTTIVTAPGRSDTIVVLNGGIGTFPFFFTLAEASNSPVSEYWVAVSTAVDGPFVPDILPWVFLYNHSFATSRSENVRGKDGKLFRVVAGSVDALVRQDSRIRVSIAAFNAAGPKPWLRGDETLETIAAVAITSQTFVVDTTAPIFDTTRDWQRSLPIAVYSPIAQFPPAIDGSISYGDIYAVANASMTVTWAKVWDSFTDITDVSYRLTLSPALPNGADTVIWNWLPVVNPAFNRSIDFTLPAGMYNRQIYYSNWINGPYAISNMGVSAGVRSLYAQNAVTGSTLANCRALCSASKDCTAFQFEVVSSNTCNVYRQVTQLASRTVTDSVTFVSRQSAQPVYKLEVRATNSIGLSTTIAVSFVVDPLAAVFAPNTVAVLATSTCTGTTPVNLALHSVSAITWVPDALTGKGKVCIGFQQPTGNAYSISTYTLAIGTSPNTDNILSWYRLQQPNVAVVPNEIRNTTLDGTVLTTIPRAPLYNIVSFTREFWLDVTNISNIFVSVRAYTPAGIVSQNTSAPLTIVSNRATTEGFIVYPAANRSSSTTFDAWSKKLFFSWTGPGGDIAKASWNLTSNTAPVPSGLARFEVGISTTKEVATLLENPGWINAGLSQAVTMDGATATVTYDMFDVCGVSSFTGSADVGYYGWSFVPPPSSLTVTSTNGSALVTNPGECCARCTSSDCVAWTFFTSMPTGAHNCFVYQRVSQVVATRRAISGAVGLLPTPFAAYASPVDTCGRTFVQYDIIASVNDPVINDPTYTNGARVNSMQDCCDLCHSSTVCIAWRYLPNEDAGPDPDFPVPNCFPLGHVGSGGVEYNEDVTIGVSSGFTSTLHIVRGYMFTSVTMDPENPSLINAVSPTHCISLCRNSEQCQAWMYNNVTSKCTLIASALNITVTASTMYMGTMMRWMNPLDGASATSAPLSSPPLQLPACTSAAIRRVEPDTWTSIGLTYPSLRPVPVSFVEDNFSPFPARSGEECCSLCTFIDTCILARYDANADPFESCQLITAYQRFRPSDTGTNILVYPVKLLRTANFYAQVAVVANSGVRTTVASPPFTLTTYSGPITGRIDQIISVTSTGLTISCDWRSFNDPTGARIRYWGGVWIHRFNTSLDGVLGNVWTDYAAGTSFTSVIAPSVLTSANAVGIRCAVRTCTSVNWCINVLSDTNTTVDFTPIQLGTVSIAGISPDQDTASTVFVGAIPRSVSSVVGYQKTYASAVETNVVTVVWSPFSCGRSGIESFTICLGEYQGGCSLGTNKVSPGPDKANIELTKTPVNGGNIYATVTAQCMSRLLAVSNSPPVLIDNTPPTPPVYIGIGDTLAATNITLTINKPIIRNFYQSFFCSWTPANDPETGIYGYTYNVSYAYKPDIVFATDNIQQITTTNTRFDCQKVRKVKQVCGTRSMGKGLAPRTVCINADYDDWGQGLSEGPVYCIVTAINAAGMASLPVISAPLIVDWSKPVINSTENFVSVGLYYGKHQSISEETWDQLTVYWSPIYDAGTGIVKYEVCITRSVDTTQRTGTCNFRAWETADGGNKHIFTFPNINAAPQWPVNYYVCVRGWDGIGLSSDPVCSPAFQVDNIPPSVSYLVRADTILEEQRQIASLSFKGYKYWHLVASNTLQTVANQLLTTVINTTSPGYNRTSSDIQSLLRLQADVTKAGGVRPRLTIGTPFGNGIGTQNGTSCRVSSRPSDVTVFTYNVTVPTKNNDTMIAYGRVNGVSTRIEVGCVAGSEYSNVMNACIPCADGYFKSLDGTGVCTKCPSNTAAFASAASALITDVSEQTRRQRTVGGTISCDCWDTTQIFVNATVGCVCAPGYVTNPQLINYPSPSYRDGKRVIIPGNPLMCIPLPSTPDGQNYKHQPGNDASLARNCPPGSVPTNDRTNCICGTNGAQLVTGSNTCECGPDTYLSTTILPDGTQRKNCILCPYGTMKQTFGNSLTMCRPCPWGTRPSNGTGINTCIIDDTYIVGDLDAVSILPDSSSIACRPGNSIYANCGINISLGWGIEIVRWRGFTDAANGPRTRCLPLPSRLYTGRGNVPVLDGVALINGLTVAVRDDEDSRFDFSYFLWFRKTEREYRYVPSLVWPDGTGEGKVPFLPNGAQRVRFTGVCSIPEEVCTVGCTPCPATGYQPSYLRITGDAAAEARKYKNNLNVAGALGQCGTCPSYLRGSYYTSSERIVFANWMGVFNESQTRITGYEWAIGSTVGGSQIVPFQAVDATVTNVNTTVEGVVTGTPLYLIVVAIDYSGNRAVFEDTRPVIIDDTAPLPGYVLDTNLDRLLVNSTATKYLQSIGAYGSSSTVSGTTTVEELRGTVKNTPTNASALLRANVNAVNSTLTDVNTANINSTRAALAALQFTDITNAGFGSSLNGTDWRLDVTFFSLYGFPDSDFSPTTKELSFAWEPFLDMGSGIYTLGYCVGTLPYSCDIYPITRMSNPRLLVDSIVLTNITLPAGIMVYATVFASNGVGMVSMGTTNGIVTDDRPPVKGIVYDVGRHFQNPLRRTGDSSPATALVPVDIDCDIVTGGIGAVWEGFSALAGISYFEWCAGTEPNRCNILPYRNVGLHGSAYDNTAKGTIGSIVYVTVRATGRNGQSTTVSSDGVRIVGTEIDADYSDSVDINGTRISTDDITDSMFVCFSVTNNNGIVNLTLGQNVSTNDPNGPIVIGLPDA